MSSASSATNGVPTRSTVMLSGSRSASPAFASLPVVDDADRHRREVERPHAVVRRRREVEDVAGDPRALAALERRRVLAAVGPLRRHLDPAHGAAGADGRRLERAAGQVAVAVRPEPVEPAAVVVLREVHEPGRAVRRRSLVRPDAERRGAPRPGRAGTGRTPRPCPLRNSSHGEPRAPRRRAARAVPLGAGEDPVGVEHLAAAREAHRRHAAARPVELAVGDQHPAAVRRRERRRAVGLAVPDVARARHGLPRAGEQPRGEARGQADAVRVRPRSSGPWPGAAARAAAGRPNARQPVAARLRPPRPSSA